MKHPLSTHCYWNVKWEASCGKPAVGSQLWAGFGKWSKWCSYLNQPHPNDAVIYQTVQNHPLKAYREHWEKMVMCCSTNSTLGVYDGWPMSLHIMWYVTRYLHSSCCYGSQCTATQLNGPRNKVAQVDGYVGQDIWCYSVNLIIFAFLWDECKLMFWFVNVALVAASTHL